MYAEPRTRAEADRMALQFLQAHGPHTMGKIEDEGAMSAALIFLDLEKLGWVSRTNFGGGLIQFAITPAGERALACADGGEAA